MTVSVLVAYLTGPERDSWPSPGLTEFLLSIKSDERVWIMRVYGMIQTQKP